MSENQEENPDQNIDDQENADNQDNGQGEEQNSQEQEQENQEQDNQDQLGEPQQENNQPLDESKTFVTQQKKQPDNIIWKAFDFLFPAGKLAKLVRIYDVDAPNFPFFEILNKLKLSDGYPVINLIGAKDVQRGKFLAGIARAAFNTDAVILDNAIATGIEKYTIRRGVKLIGIAPENEIKFPKINPTFVDPFELANGHTHLFLLNNKENDLVWTQEALFKSLLALRLSEGKPSKRGTKQPCKVVNVLLADSQFYEDDLRYAVKNQQAVIVVKGSQVSDEIIQFIESQKEQNEEEQNQQEFKPKLLKEETMQLIQQGHFFVLNSSNSEDIAQYIHFLLTVTPWIMKQDHENREKAKKQYPPQEENKDDNQNLSQMQQSQQP